MKQTLAIWLFIVAFSGSSLFTELWYRTDDLSLRYNLWKVGLWPRPEHLLGSLIADRGGPLRYMTKEEIIELFPEAHENAEHGTGERNKFEKRYMNDIHGGEHLWLCPNDVIVIFENGKFEYLFLAKG